MYIFMYSVYIVNLYVLFKRGPQGRLEKIQMSFSINKNIIIIMI